MASLSGRRWRHRLAAHLGIASPDTPQFAASAGSIDPVVQIEHVAALGFAGVTDNGLKLRSPDVQQRMGEALARTGLAMGTFVHSPPGRSPYPWTRAGVAVDVDMAESIAAAKRVGGGTINVILCDTGGPREAQLATARDNLARPARIAAQAGLAIGLEPANVARVPRALVEEADEAAAIVRTVGHPALRLILDSCHVHLSGDDMADAVRRHADLLIAVQIADMPGRVEPGAGALDMAGIAAALDAIGWQGLVEAEFLPSRPSPDGEAAVLVGLDRFCGF